MQSRGQSHQHLRHLRSQSLPLAALPASSPSHLQPFLYQNNKNFFLTGALKQSSSSFPSPCQHPWELAPHPIPTGELRRPAAKASKLPN